MRPISGPPCWCLAKQFRTNEFQTSAPNICTKQNASSTFHRSLQAKRELTKMSQLLLDDSGSVSCVSSSCCGSVTNFWAKQPASWHPNVGHQVLVTRQVLMSERRRQRGGSHRIAHGWRRRARRRDSATGRPNRGPVRRTSAPGWQWLRRSRVIVVVPEKMRTATENAP